MKMVRVAVTETEPDLQRSVVSRLHLGSWIAAAALAVIGCWGPVAAATPLGGATTESLIQGSIDSATYRVSPRIGQPRSKFIATLRNEGTSTIEVGRDFTISRRTPDGWRRLRHGRNCAWPADARIIQPGDSWSQRVGLLGRRCRFRALEPGVYRVNKPIRFTDNFSAPREDVVRARFEVAR